MKTIAETAWHHDGDFRFFKNLVEQIVIHTSADYIKFHISLDADEYMHTDHPAYNWVVERMFTIDQWKEIIDLAVKSGKKPMLLFNDKKAIDFGMVYNPELVEIHSVCLNDFNLLNFLRSKLNENTKVILGVGGSSIYEIENAISILNWENIVLMHGFQNYPTNYVDINIGKIKKIMQLYPVYEHGYADHTAWDHENNILITLFVAALGMQYIEKHVTFSTGKGKPDWQAAVSIETFNELISKLDILRSCYGNGFLELNQGEKAYALFGPNKKAAILTHNVQKGDEFKQEDFTFKRTAQEADLSQIEVLNYLGKTFNKDLPDGHCILRSDF